MKQIRMKKHEILYRILTFYYCLEYHRLNLIADTRNCASQSVELYNILE